MSGDEPSQIDFMQAHIESLESLVAKQREVIAIVDVIKERIDDKNLRISLKEKLDALKGDK